MLHGYDCFHAAQGMPYDLIADVGGRLLRVQVKTTRRPENLSQRNINALAYRFWVSRCGNGGKERYSPADVDLFALVALDTKQVGYLSAARMPRTLFVRPDSMRGKYLDEVTVARNQEVLGKLQAGAAPSDLMAEYGITAGYVQKIKHGRARTHVAGLYMDDLPLSGALASLASNDNTPPAASAAR